MTSELSPLPRPATHRAGSSILLAVSTVFATSAWASGVANAIPEFPKVTYQLSGSAAVAEYISYQTDTGQALQAQVPLPWQTQFKATGPGVYGISAQSPGSITCTIMLDGKVVNQATANGAPARTVCTY